MDAEEENKNVEAPKSISFSEFLEGAHPGVVASIHDLWKKQANTRPIINRPGIRIHCASEDCGGIRTFRSGGEPNYVNHEQPTKPVFFDYFCGDCRLSSKRFALLLTTEREEGNGQAFKYGENPKFGVPVDNKLLRLFGKDSSVFLKGRQCENQGLGVGAFAYYRRVVENHRSDIIDGIIAVSKTVGAPENLITNLENAKAEISFAKSIDVIKDGIPQGLLINGHNPLTLLHKALSVGLHSASDEECLSAAHDIRLVLAELADRMAALKKNDAELSAAVHRLLKSEPRGAVIGN